jgi:hypothetical protein
MREISVLDRSLLLATGLLSAYQIAVGIEGIGNLAVICYTIAFGLLLVADLMMLFVKIRNGDRRLFPRGLSSFLGFLLLQQSQVAF